MSGCVVMLCRAEELDKERRGYHRAFLRQGLRVELIPPERGAAWLEDVRALRPLLVLNPDAAPWDPDDIERVEFPTAVFHIDTFAGTQRRVRSAALYDHVFVFHPGFEERFAHPGVGLLPHAADREMLADPARPRRYDVGWVGHRGRAMYAARDRVLDALAPRFAMNETGRAYSFEEMTEIYGSSRVVVNVSRDDWPADANMRCFEAMAAGALLVTRVPSELTALGFEEGVHFAGYRDPAEAADVVAKFLGDEAGRLAIATRGHELVAREHTYDARAAAILDAAASGTRAPARSWPTRVALQRHFEIDVERGDVRASLRSFARLGRESVAGAAASSPRWVRLAAKVMRRWL